GQREILRARAELLVDLLDAQTGILGDERMKRVRELVELVAAALGALAPTAASAADAVAARRPLAESALERVDRGAACELGDLRNEARDHTIHLVLEVTHIV